MPPIPTLPAGTRRLSTVPDTTLAPVADLDATVRSALAAPRGLPRIRDLVKPDARVTIAFDDHTTGSFGPIRPVAIRSVLDGTWQGGTNLVFGLADEGVGLGTISSAAAPEDVEAVDEVRREEGLSYDTLVVHLKYGRNRERIITDLKRVSKPGRRVYARKDRLPKVLGGLGTAILSTSTGVITQRQAAERGVGGEVGAFVW